MPLDFGTGRRLIDTHPDLRDAVKRIAMILDVAERNSVIEGLPPFTPELREQLRQELFAQCRAAGEKVPPPPVEMPPHHSSGADG